MALRAGRRWGKTDFGKVVAIDAAMKGQLTGWFAPDYRISSESYDAILDILEPAKLRASKVEGMIKTKTGGSIEFWTLDNERAGRSRKYHKVLIDEGAFTKPRVMMDVWNKSIKPTLLDYRGKALVMSNTNGVDIDNFLWQVCNQPEHGFSQFHAPTHNNPHLPREELDKLVLENHPLVYQQEYLAEFVDWSGVAFFSLEKLLVEGQPPELPGRCDAVFAVVDSAVKTGRTNDGTGVVWFAFNKIGGGPPLVVLDWDVQQISGDLLEHWLPTVFQRSEELAKQCRARAGNIGTWIEDKASGMVLIQQSVRRGLNVRAIDSKLTSVGKDERAISVSGYVHSGKVKLSRLAYDKVSQYKGATRNHLTGQVLGFRVGDKDASREDDLLDCFTYGIAIALGNSGGF